ncbi:MAG: aromatic ring-hydroxylating dioxygenase subunit alpha [Actinomycetes bacterium]
MSATAGTPADAVTSLSAAELRECSQRSGSMLPAAAYVGDDVLRWEQEHFFEGGWACVGRSDGLAAPGQRRALQVGSDGLVLVRGADGVLRGFANACRHRGHELMPCGSSASGSFVRCPYHAWVYDTSGQLYGVPPTHADDVPDRSQLGLKPFPTVEWHGFVFVNTSGDAPPIDGYLGGLDDVVAPYGLADLRVGASHEYELATNWKLIVENYHECFHCESIHPELCEVSSPDSGTHVVGNGLWLGGTMWLRDGAETMSLDGRSGGVPIPGLPVERLRDIVYIHVFPNLLISLHPDYAMTHRMVALAPDRTAVECQWLFPAQAWERDGFDPSYASDFWDLTNRQDWAACESVQRGVSTRGFEPGPLSTSTEYVVKSFVDLVVDGYLNGGLPTPTPVTETVRSSSAG